jgi:outer membrane lipoprotein-sorting protein
VGWRAPVLLFGALLAGCAAQRPPGPYAAPEKLPSAEELTGALAQRREAVHSLRGLARLRLRDGAQSTTSREAVVVERPDRLRVEVLSAFGSAFVLTADKGALSAYAPSENTVYQGAASPENLARYAGVGVPVAALVDLMLGTPPPSQSDDATVGFDPNTGWTGLSELVPDGLRVTWFSQAQVPVLVEQRDGNDAVLWRATFGNHEDHGGLLVPTYIALEVPSRSRAVEINLEGVDVNPQIDQSLFALQPPRGTKVVSLDRPAQ